jgi:hypothetical protein
MIRFMSSKLKKTKALLKNKSLTEYVPATKKMTAAVLREMLHNYKMVYIKPDRGTFGSGVMRLDYKPGTAQPYRYQIGTTIRKFSDFPSLMASVRRRTGGKLYLVQKGIHMLKYGGRHFDLRVMVQRNPDNVWETTGIIGRVAHPRKIVTNYHNGGTPTPVEKLLKPYVSRSGIKRYVNSLSRLGLRVARQISSVYPGFKELGLDIALDHRLKPWILEVNTAPDPYIFRKLKDKSVYAKVIRYHRFLRNRAKKASSH